MSKRKKLPNFEEKLLGPRKDFPKWPPAPGNSDFLILARNFSKCQRPKTAQETSFLRFPARGGSVGKNVEPKKDAQFSGENFRSPKRFPETASNSSGKFRFSDFGPEFLQVPKAQNGPRNQFSAVSRPWGSSWGACQSETTCAIFRRNF